MMIAFSFFFKDILESSIELCKFPPPPDAVCRLQKCLCPLKAEIFLTDPDFKVKAAGLNVFCVKFLSASVSFPSCALVLSQGYVQTGCCQSCRVEFHINCWKSLKTTRFLEKSEKVSFRPFSCL